MRVMIHFKGMFIFSPRNAGTDAAEMLVVLPGSKPLGGAASAHAHRATAPMGRHLHVPFLRVDTSAIVERDRRDTGPKTVKFFDGFDLEFPEFKGPAKTDLLDLANVTDVLSPTKAKTLDLAKATSAIRLTGGWMRTVHRYCNWRWLGENRRIGLEVKWYADVDGKEFPIRVKAHGGTASVPLLTLKPPGGQRLDFEVFHFPEEDVAEPDKKPGLPPDKGTPAAHFSMLYQMFDIADADSLAVPLFQEFDRKAAKGASAKRGVEPITCVPGGCSECCDDC